MISSAIIPQPLARLPWKLISIVFGICAIGLITLYSAAGGSFTPWALKQGATRIFFFLVALGVSWIPEDAIKQLTFPAYGAILVLLIVVEAVGFVGKGAQRWVDLGFIRLQPSEFMKPAIVVTLARFYSLLPAGDVRKLRGLWPAAALLFVPAGLILVQPDLGTAMMVILSGVTVMFLAGLTMTIFYYFSVNLMMVMGMAPVVGIPLPLVSFGGSAVMTVMLCLGVLMGLERQQRTRARIA